jgi:hypothetical protein
MTPKEKEYAKQVLDVKLSDLKERSTNSSTENVKNLYYQPKIRALENVIKLINSIPDEESIDFTIDVLNAAKSRLFLNSAIEQVDNSINYLLNSL